MVSLSRYDRRYGRCADAHYHNRVGAELIARQVYFLANERFAGGKAGEFRRIVLNTATRYGQQLQEKNRKQPA
jgi:hypothetical protein